MFQPENQTENGAGEGSRTLTELPPRDFESRAYASFATPARKCETEVYQMKKPVHNTPFFHAMSNTYG